MSLVSTHNKFLGSLIAAYIGYSYSRNHPQSWPPVSNSNLYRSWLDSIEQSPPSRPALSNASLIRTLPWLLYHYDNSQLRHYQLAQNLKLAHEANISNIIDITAALHIMGDCLEWLMQFPPSTQQPLTLLCDYLQQQRSDHSQPINAKRNQVIKALATNSSLSDIDNVVDSTLLSTVTMAIRQCLTYRENLALAFASSQIGPPIPTLIGCLQGAWAGTSVIPDQWMIAFHTDSRQSLAYIAQMLYRRWAGITSSTTTKEVLPLDL